MKRMGWPKGWIILGVGFLLFGCATAEDVRILDGENRRLHSQVNMIQKDMEPLQKGMEGYRKEVSKDITDLREKNILTRADLSAEVKKVQADLVLRLEALQSEVRNYSTGVEEYKEFVKKPPQEQSKELERVRETVSLRMKNVEDKERALEEKNRVIEERIRASEERFKWAEDRLRGTEDRFKGAEDRLKGLEDHSKGIEDRSKGMEDRFKGLDGKIDLVGSRQADLEKRIAAREAKEKEPPPLPPPPVAEVKQPPPPLMGSADLYKDSLDTFYRNDMEGARRKFESFLKNYPNAQLSNNAQFWIGETYYRQKDYERAILEYEKVIVKYPEGDKVPAAMLKQGLAFLELGDRTNARNLLKRVVERYPQSDQAELARKRLEGLK